MDPQGETLTRAHVWQPERTWILQLEASHEAAAQHEAVAALAALPNPSHAAVAALRACLFSDTMFCRCTAPGHPLTLACSTACLSADSGVKGRPQPAVNPRCDAPGRHDTAAVPAATVCPHSRVQGSGSTTPGIQLSVWQLPFLCYSLVQLPSSAMRGANDAPCPLIHCRVLMMPGSLRSELVCRVRAEAARALGTIASVTHDSEPLQHLIAFFHKVMLNGLPLAGHLNHCQHPIEHRLQRSQLNAAMSCIASLAGATQESGSKPCIKAQPLLTCFLPGPPMYAMVAHKSTDCRDMHSACHSCCCQHSCSRCSGRRGSAQASAVWHGFGL